MSIVDGKEVADFVIIRDGMFWGGVCWITNVRSALRFYSKADAELLQREAFLDGSAVEQLQRPQ